MRLQPTDRKRADGGQIRDHNKPGSDVLKFDKSIAPDPNDVDPFNDIGTAPMVASIAAKKLTESGGGNAL